MARQGVFPFPAEEKTAEAAKQASEQAADGKQPPREKQFLPVLAEKTGRQNRNIGMCFHIGYHPPKQGRMEGNSRIHHEMVFALQLGQYGVVRAGRADVLFLGKHHDTGESPLQPVGRQFVGGIVAEKDGNFQVRILDAAESDVNLVPAAVHDKTRGKNRGHAQTPPPCRFSQYPFYFTGNSPLCKESEWQKPAINGILDRIAAENR